jgi:hypothetical protein
LTTFSIHARIGAVVCGKKATVSGTARQARADSEKSA